MNYYQAFTLNGRQFQVSFLLGHIPRRESLFPSEKNGSRIFFHNGVEIATRGGVAPRTPFD
jgi:hypothetical protein